MTWSGTILIAYDGSGDAQRAIEVAARMVPGAEEAALEVAREGRRLADEAGLTALPATAFGTGSAGVADALCQAADEHDVELVVVGASRGSRLLSMLLGSVSDAVAHHAHRPVLIVPATE
jgi:nucleotide-binding universal stress UspA family protein